VPNAVTALRRYPVKSMGGEALEVAALDARGVVGDRWYAVEDDEGHFASGKDTTRFRRRDAVFDYAARTERDGRVTVSRSESRWHVDDRCLAERLSTEMGTAVRITPEGVVPHQDMGAVSIVSTATLRWCAQQWGGSPDARRLRANIVVEAEEPFAEERWLHRELELGSTRLHVVERVPRCRMIDIGQDGVEPGAKWLRCLGREREMCLAVYADVTRPGRITIGDEPRLVHPPRP
jgi:uncharacterized protein YcbX